MAARIGDIEREDDLIPKNRTTDTQTNIIGSGNPVVVVNQDKKKKPFDVKFSNNEPKIKPNIKYSAKQSYRRYKSKTEPNLNSNIMVNEEDDIVKQIKKAFGINPENTNYSSVESAPFPVPDNFDNFQTPTDFAQVPSIGTNNDFLSKYDDDYVLFSFRYGYDLEANEKFEFDKIRNEIENKDITPKEMMEKVSEALEKFIIDNNIENTFTKKQIPQLKKIGNLTLKEAKDYVDKNLSVEEQTALAVELTDEMEQAKKYNKEDEIPTDDQLFMTLIKNYQLSKLKEEMELSNMTKAQEEALIGQKIQVAKQNDDSDEFEEVFEDMPSPSKTELSAKTTEPYGSSVGEITSVEEAKRKPGRPAKKPETIAKQQSEKTVKSFHLTKKKNVDKTFNFNQKERMEYNLDFYNSFNN